MTMKHFSMEMLFMFPDSICMISKILRHGHGVELVVLLLQQHLLLLQHGLLLHVQGIKPCWGVLSKGGVLPGIERRVRHVIRLVAHVGARPSPIRSRVAPGHPARTRLLQSRLFRPAALQGQH